MPNNINVTKTGWTVFSSPENDKSILIPLSLRRSMARAANLDQSLREVNYITVQNISLWSYAHGNTVSNATIQQYLDDCVEEKLLLAQGSGNDTYYVRTSKWVNLSKVNQISNIKLTAQAAIQKIKESSN